jgi:hypothetical protein
MLRAKLGSEELTLNTCDQLKTILDVRDSEQKVLLCRIYSVTIVVEMANGIAYQAFLIGLP